jgi:hypothetical protein
MEKWARRQDKIKMSFKQNQTPSVAISVEKPIVSNNVVKSTQNVGESLIEPIKVYFKFNKNTFFMKLFLFLDLIFGSLF